MTPAKRIFSLICALIMIGCVVSCGKKEDDAPLMVSVVKEKCNFKHVSFDGTNIVYDCEMTLFNSGDTDETVVVKGLFEWEKERGILESAECYAVSATGENTFEVPKGLELTAHIIFRAKKAEGYFGEEVKRDRLFPDVEISRALEKD